MHLNSVLWKRTFSESHGNAADPELCVQSGEEWQGIMDPSKPGTKNRFPGGTAAAIEFPAPSIKRDITTTT